MSDNHKHHILENSIAYKVFGALLVGTVITVWAAEFDFGMFNFLIAILIATAKAMLVVLFFMGLKYDDDGNTLIFGMSFIFLAIFIILTSTDIFFRGDYLTGKGPLLAAAKEESKFEKPWVSTPEIVTHGADKYKVLCASCHGPSGQGDGVAAAALNPKPRNFALAGGWKKGRKPSQVFETLTKGLPGTSMGAFNTESAENRWALVHYVLSLGPKGPSDSASDLAKVGIDTSKPGGGLGAEKPAPSIPVDLAIEEMAVD